MNQETLEKRKLGLGGTDISAILGINPYKSPLDVYLEKVEGKITPDNKFMRAGRHLENAVANMLKEEKGIGLYDCESVGEDKMIYDKKFNYLFGTPDRYILSEKFTFTGIAEIKTTQNKLIDVPPHWFCQLIWYLGISNLQNGIIAWLERGLEFHFEEYTYTEDFYLMMREAGVKFWQDNILKKVKPEPVNVKDILSLYPSHIQGKTLIATQEVENEIIELKGLRMDLAKMNDRKEEIESRIKMIMSDAECIMNQSKETLITWKKDKDGLQLDTDKLKEDKPKIYEKYLITKQGSRKFLVK